LPFKCNLQRYNAGGDGGSSSDDEEEWRSARMRARPGTVAPAAPPRDKGRYVGGNNAAAAAESAADRASAAAKQAMAAAQRATAAAESREAVINQAEARAAREEEAKKRMEEENVSRAAAAVKAAAVRKSREAEEHAAKVLDAEAEAEAARAAEEAAKVAAARASQDAAKAEERRMAGNVLFRKGDYQGAADAYSAVLSRHPGDAAALANRAAALLQLGDAAAAEDDATKCLYIDPGHDKARHRRAQARRKLGDVAGALTDLEELRKRLPHHTGVSKDLAEVRRLVAHADPSADAAAMEAHARERREAAAKDEAAWEAKRDAGVKAHRDKQQSKTAAAAAAAAGDDEEKAKRARKTTTAANAASSSSQGGGGGDTTDWTEVIETHHPGRSIVHPQATFSSRRLGAVPGAVRALAGGAPLPPPPPPGAFTLSLDVTEGGAESIATALEWTLSGGSCFAVVALALVTEDATPGEVLKGDAPMLGNARRALLVAAEGASTSGKETGAAAAKLATEQGAALKVTADAGWDKLQADPALFMGHIGAGSKGPDQAAEFAVGVFDGGCLSAAGGSAVAACRHAAEEGLDVVALRSVLATDADQARLLASFSPHRIGVAQVFGAGTDANAKSGGGGATLAIAVRGRKAVARWRAAVGADLTPQVAAQVSPDCLRAALHANVMSVSLSAATARRELAFLFGGRVVGGLYKSNPVVTHSLQERLVSALEPIA
jgi:tetratricopeptide (TPR) repeat protein